MYSKTKMTSLAAVAVIFALSTVSCVKQRTDLVDPSEKTLTIIKDAPVLDAQWKASSDGLTSFKRTNFTIGTSVELFKSQNTIAEQLLAEPESGLKFLNVMNFKSDHELLDGKAEIAYMLGEPKRTYSIVEELTPTHLILYKVVSDSELGFNEQTFAKRDGSNWLVPLGGYAVTYLIKEKAKNEDNRDTNVIVYRPLPSSEYKKATNMRIDKYAFIPFERFVKSDVLPKTFFDGEWYFTETTVDVSYSKGAAVGDLGGSDSNFSSATRIRFKIFDDQLVAQNTNIDEEFKDDPNSLNYGTVLKIGIEHRDFRWVNIGPDALKEVEEETKSKASKRFIKLNYLESDTPQVTAEAILGSIFGKINNFRNVIDVTYGKDYFSYSIRDAQSQTLKRYSMRKIDPQQRIAPRQAFKADNRIFGAFTTQKYKKIDYKISQNEDVEKLLIMARHNPNKDIVYYFTDRTPCEKLSETCKTIDPNGKWYRDIGRESINLWAQAFAKAGLKITVRLDESKDVALGDIRYNVLNIVKRAGAGLLGFGPSLIDSETGEIVSSSMNTGVDNIIEQYYRVVRNYLGRKSGRTYNFKDDQGDTELPGVLSYIAKVNTYQYRFDAKSGQLLMGGKSHLDPSVFTDKEKEFLRYFKIAPNASIKEFVDKVTELRLHSYRYANIGNLFNVSMFNADEIISSTMVLDDVIEKNCVEVVDLAKRMESELVTTPEEIQIIEPCVKLLAQGEAVVTTVHELGHNFSLRHNFKGSVDKANFPVVEDVSVPNSNPKDGYKLAYIKLADGVAKQMTSSIMEYVTQEGQQLMPGLYDIAAIRWIYGESVEKKDGTLVKVKTEKPIEQQVSKAELKPFEFCTDEQRILVTDPMCNSFDKGTTVKETVRFQIEQVYNALGSAYRYNKVGPGTPVLSLMVNGMSLKAKYDKWRGFLRKFTGTNKSYLQGYNVQSYDALMKKIASNPADAKLLKEHLEVRNMIVRFLVDLAFISNKYCVVVDSENEEKLIELEKIRKELFGAEEFSVISSCKSPAAKQYLDDRKLTLVKEFGHFLDAGQFNLDPTTLTSEPMDFSGTASVRQWAVAIMTWRLNPASILQGYSSINNAIEGFAPNMMDEPDIRNYVQTLILDRLVNGVRIAQDNSQSDYALPKSDLFGAQDVEKIFSSKSYTNFNNESALIQLYTQLLNQELGIPNAPDDGRAAYMTVNTAPITQREYVETNAANYIEYADRFLFVQSNTSFSGVVMNRFKTVNQLKNLVLGVTPGQLLAAQPQVLQALDPVLFKAPNAPTLAELLKVYEFLTAVIPQLQQSPGGQPIAYALITIFDPELQLIEMFSQTLNAQGVKLSELTKMATSEDPAQKDLATTILATPLDTAYAELQKQDPTVVMPTVDAVKVRYEKLIVDHTAVSKNYNKSAEEFDSQIDLLQRVIQVLAQ